MGAVQLRGAQAVERADDPDPEVAGEPPALALEALAVHHEAAREIGARRVRDAADAVAAVRDPRGGRGGGALAAVAVEDEHRDLPAREVRGRGACAPARWTFAGAVFFAAFAAAALATGRAAVPVEGFAISAPPTTTSTSSSTAATAAATSAAVRHGRISRSS